MVCWSSWRTASACCVDRWVGELGWQGMGGRAVMQVGRLGWIQLRPAWQTLEWCDPPAGRADGCREGGGAGPHRKRRGAGRCRPCRQVHSCVSYAGHSASALHETCPANLGPFFWPALQARGTSTAAAAGSCTSLASAEAQCRLPPAPPAAAPLAAPTTSWQRATRQPPTSSRSPSAATEPARRPWLRARAMARRCGQRPALTPTAAPWAAQM